MDIKVTDTTGVFKTIEGNRELKKSHVSRLKEAIGKNAESIKYTPILVNEKMEVIDGQHRLEALKQLDLPVHYIRVEGLKLEDVQQLNSLSKRWTPVDYARSFAQKGNKNYQTYLYFKRDFGLNHDVLMRYLSLDNPITSQMFNDGKLKVKDAKKSHDLATKLLDFKEFYERGFKRRSFALAFKKLWEQKNYDHDYFIKKLRSRGTQMKDRAVPRDYMRDFETLYNSYLREEGDQIYFNSGDLQ